MKRLLLVAAALLCACGFAPPLHAQSAATASLPNYAGSTLTATDITNSAHSATATIASNGAIALTLYLGEYYTFSVSAASPTFPAFTTGRTRVAMGPYQSVDISQALQAGAASVYMAPSATPGSLPAINCNGKVISAIDSSGNATCVPAGSASPATSSSPGSVQLYGSQTATTLSMIATTGQLGDAYGAYNTSQALKGTNVDLFRNNTYTGTGWSYGTGPTFTAFYNQSWLVDQLNQWNANFNRRSIHQMLASFDFANAIGDDAYIYAYLMGVGGNRAGADEGQTVLHGQWGERTDYPQGLVASSTATGLTSLSINPVLFNAAGTQQFCDGCYLVQKTNGVTGHYTGTPTAVTGSGPQQGGGTTTQNLYWTQPVDITLTPSVYGTLLGCPAAGGGPIPQSSAPMVYQTDTCTFTATNGAFPVGPLTIAGQNLDHGNITSVQPVSGSGASATQQITFTHKDMNGVGLTTIFTGGPQSTINMPAWPESIPYLAGATVGQPVGNPVYGAIDAHTLAMGEPHGGAPDMPTTFYNSLGAFSLNQVGTAVSGYAVNQFNRTFIGLSGVVVSGCGNAIDGVIPGPISESANVLSWASSTNTGFITCANATLSLPPAMTQFTNYPYAEQIAGDTALPVYYPKTPANDAAGLSGTLNPQATAAAMAATRIFTLEANSVPWQNGAVVEEVHPNTQDGNALWLNHQNGNPSSINTQHDILLTGVGVSTGKGAWFEIQNNAPFSWFQGAGGLVLPKPFIRMTGANSGSVSTLPMNGTSIWSYLCPTSDPTCQYIQNLWSINNHVLATWNDPTQVFKFPNAGGVSVLSEGTYFNNTELGGKLNFTGQTTQSFTLTSTDSVLSPIVTLQCEFNCNGNQPWPSYSMTTGSPPNYYVLTVNFATAVGSSGTPLTVSYRLTKRTY